MDSDDTDCLAIEIAECRSMGFRFFGPDVNESFKDFAIVPHEKKIRLVFWRLRRLVSGAVDAVLNARKSGGKFTTIQILQKRVNARQFNKKAWDSLIMTGAFDQFGTRSDLLFNLERIQEYGSKSQKEALSGRLIFLGLLVPMICGLNRQLSS